MRRRLALSTIVLGIFFISLGPLAARAQTTRPIAVPAAPSDIVVPAAVTGMTPQFRLPFVLNAHAPSAPVTNLYGGPEVEQNTSVATDGAGHWVAVWHSTDTLQGRSGRDYDILVAHSIDNGVTWSRPAALNTNASTDFGDDLAPIIRTDEGGTWIAAWMSTETFGGQYGLDRDLFFARSTDNGETWSDPAPLNTNAAQDWGDDFEPRLATDGSGNWVAAWSSNDSLGNRKGGDRDILVTRSTDNGKTWTHPAPLNNNATSDKGFDSSPDIVTDASGRWLCAWSAGDSGIQGIGTDRDILIAHSDDKGATWSDPAPLNSNATSDENSDWTPRLASDGRGNWVTVWSSADSMGETKGVDRDILVSRSTDNGNTWSTARALNRNAANDAREDAAPAIASDGTGNWLVIWHAWGGLSYSDGSDADIAVAYSVDDGASWTDPVHINEHAATDDIDDILSSLATDGAGHWVATWQSFHPPDETAKTSEWRILASAGVLEADGVPQPAPTGEKPAPPPARAPQAAGDGVSDDGDRALDALEGAAPEAPGGGLPGAIADDEAKKAAGDAPAGEH